jgi:small subunit ribosomal protein S20
VANHASAVKRHKQSVRRRQRNLAIKTKVRHLVRAVRSAIDSKDLDLAQRKLAAATSELAKAAGKGVYHRNAAARRAGRLSRAVARLTAAS